MESFLHFFNSALTFFCVCGSDHILFYWAALCNDYMQRLYIGVFLSFHINLGFSS